MKLAKGYMKRVVIAMKFETVLEDDELIIQGVRFAFHVHQVVSLCTTFPFNIVASPY